jgi:hypothetical protein
MKKFIHNSKKQLSETNKAGSKVGNLKKVGLLYMSCHQRRIDFSIFL